jgi:hypothetical protein
VKRATSYLRDYTFDIAEHVVVPEPQNVEALTFYPRLPCLVFSAAGMPTAVDFDNQASLVTHEVDDEASNGLLTPETKASYLFSAQMRSQQPFRIRGLRTQYASPTGDRPLPLPPPARGGGSMNGNVIR